MIGDRGIVPTGLTGRRLNVVNGVFLGSPTVGASNDVHTSAANASYTAAAGTQPAAVRNLVYQASMSSTVAFASCSGTISVAGLDAQGRSITETVAVSALASASTNGIVGTKQFASIFSNGITRGALTLTSTNHAQSNNVSWYIGGGNFLALPTWVQSSSAVVLAKVGSSPVAFTTSNLFSSYVDGTRSIAAVNLSGGTYATNKPVMVWYFLNR